MYAKEVIDGLHALVDAQAKLADCINNEVHSIWMPSIDATEDPKKGVFYDAKDHLEYVQLAIASITGIEYLDGQDGRVTQKQKGILLVGPESIEQAERVNQVKVALSAELKALREHLPKKKSVAEFLEEQAGLRQILARAGIARLCVNQAKRLLPVVDKAPFRISWVERRTSSIKKISMDTAEKMLEKLNSEQATIDKAALGRLDPGTQLAIVQVPKHPTQKANIFHRQCDPESRNIEVVNRAIHAPVPILCATGNEMPRLNKGGNRSNTPRTDKKIDPKVYLQSIRAHLYQA